VRRSWGRGVSQALRLRLLLSVLKHRRGAEDIVDGKQMCRRCGREEGGLYGRQYLESRLVVHDMDECELVLWLWDWRWDSGDGKRKEMQGQLYPRIHFSYSQQFSPQSSEFDFLPLDDFCHG
jgi:hypothetical protein